MTESARAKKNPFEVFNLPANATQEQLEVAYQQKLRKVTAESEEHISLEELNWAYRELCRLRAQDSRRTDSVVSAELFPELAYIHKFNDEPLTENTNVVELNRRTGASANSVQDEADLRLKASGEFANVTADRRNELEILLEMPEITEATFHNADDEEDVLEQIVNSDTFSEVFQPKRIKAIIGEREKEVVGIRTPNSYRNEARVRVEQLIQNSTVADGKLLVQLRSALGVSAEEISSRTKINLRHIRAMEGDHFAALPALVYFRGFIDSYLKYLGIEHQGLVNAYIQNYQKAKKFSFRQLFKG